MLSKRCSIISAATRLASPESTTAPPTRPRSARRSIKYEEVHLKAYADGREARAGIGSWMTFYNFRRPHQAMNNQMPMVAWRAGMDKIEAAQRAVDMPLRLDNANALLTYPQHKQKQQEAA